MQNTNHELDKAIKRLKEIQSEMQELLAESENLVNKHATDDISARANAYWIPTIESMLDCNGGHETDMDETIREMISVFRQDDEP